jgi:hypothetical protein
MKTRMAICAITPVLALLLPLAASAAAPTHGATYEGTLYAGAAQAVSKKTVLRVKPDGKTLGAMFFCGSGRPSNSIVVKILADGSFHGFSNTGKLTVWSIQGRFLTPKTARAKLTLNVTCDGKGGTVNLTKK